jgi:nitroimidazol reductase NimA-like FMN-containing flavoprotein (pyridoxamine 5'-phosphate oxidase superfamily)
MLDIDEMGQIEIQDFLHEVGYGHLGYIHEEKPYVMPMHYYLENSDIYLFTTQGMKTHDININPEICLQVEEIHDPLHWRSVIVTGQAERLTEQVEIDRAMAFIKGENPRLSPAINRTWIDSWGRTEVITIYRIHTSEMTGRTTDGISSRALSKG